MPVESGCCTRHDCLQLPNADTTRCIIMHLETHYLQILILAAASVAAQGKGGQDQDPYVPTYTECPKNLRVRRADVRHLYSDQSKLFEDADSVTGLRDG